MKKRSLMLMGVVLMIGLLAIFAGCGGDSSSAQTVSSPTPTASPTPSPTPSQAGWTVMVYICGDNNLSDQVDYNIKQMEESGPRDNVNIVVLADKPGVNTKRYYIAKSTDPINVTSPYYDYGQNLDTGNVQVLDDFVKLCFNQYPAEHYMLILWNHGAGFVRSAGINRGICYDDTSGNNITTVQLGSEMRTLTAINPIQVLATDACLMSMFEVVYELKGANVSYFATSEATIPGEGFPYQKNWLAALASTTTPATLCTNLCDDYIAYYTQSQQSVTFSVLQMEKFFASGGTLDLFNALSAKMASLSAQNFSTVSASVLPQVQRFSTNSSSYVYSYADIRDFCRLLSLNNVAKTEADALYNNLAEGDNNFVVRGRNYSSGIPGDDSYPYAYGMSVLLNNNSYSSNWQTYYREMLYYIDGFVNWETFLKRISP